MTDALELRVLEAVAVGHSTLDALSMALAVPAAEVDDRIRWAIGERLLVATQRGESWTFALTDAGQRVVAAQNAVTGLGGFFGGMRSASARAQAQAPAPRLPRGPKRRPAPGAASIFSPVEEAQEAERQSWSLALGVIGVLAVLVLVIWLLLA